MTLNEFRASLKESQPPAGLSPALLGLWRDAAGHWDKAHEAVQSDRARESSWVHAYLHRKEGDLGNADYWYARAQKQRPEATLEAEWEAIAKDLLART
jgi:hypothetical protein